MIRITLILIFSAFSATLASSKDATALKFFETSVRPLLAAECYDCHGPDKAKSGLRLDHLDLILKGGDTGPALVPGKVQDSLLIEAVRRDDPDFAMPPKKELTADQVAILEKWIENGAVWPDEQLTQSEVDEHGFSDEDRKWWAVQPVRDVKVPALKDAGNEWAKNEIDHFILRKLDEAGLEPSAAAGPHELVRRLYLDLHGLIPTAEQAATFVKAYEADAGKATATLIDELLASPRYGERWGQHWLDVVRYAESDGYRADGFRSGTWRYRDYVINSLNDDKPYDDFVREQLAADEFAENDPDKFIATAFLRLGVYEWNQRNAKMQWDLIMTEMTNVTGEALLGIGIGCAQCHDHKFDPILQKDYFAMQAFLNGTWWPENQVLASDEEKAAYEKQLKEWEAATAAIRPELDAMKKSRIESAIQGVVKQFPEDVKAIYNIPVGERTTYEEQISQMVQRQVDLSVKKIDWKKEFSKDEKKKAQYEKLTAELAKFDKLKPAELPLGFVSVDVGTAPGETLLKTRDKTKVIEPAFLTLLGQPAPEIKPTEDSTGRRLALANWIASEENPLSTRVITNRIWQHHFGSGLVPTPNDFGRLGEEPSHPELLDWLTKRFIQGGWKMKSLHRLIMNSAAYQQTARREPTSTENIADSENRLLWRYPPRRLDAGQIRDAMLVASGEMAHRDGGPSVSGSSPARSIYVKKIRNTKDPVIGNFDAPSGFTSAPDRLATTTANQSLLLVNGEWVIARAKAFAKQLLTTGGKVGAEEIKKAYRIAYNREADAGEISDALEFIESQKGTAPTPPPAPFKFPNDNGLRPVAQKFSKSSGIELGSSALWLQPGSRFEKLHATGVELPDDHFTVEAVASLDAIYPDASVNTLVSQWSGSNGSTGWGLGVTSAKSGYDPRNLIIQIVGEDFQGNRIYEVVASDLRVPTDTPVYIAASISAVPSNGDPTKGSVTFYLKDLSDPKAELQTVTVPHQVVGGLEPKPGTKVLVGGRGQNHHYWDGQVARLALHSGAAQKLTKPFAPSAETKPIIDWKFDKLIDDLPAPRTAWVKHATEANPTAYPPELLNAVSDFCHALLDSNEFLYQH